MRMELGAIYHRTSEHYCYPLNEEELIINLKTGYDVEKVYIYQGDPYLAGIMGGQEKWQGKREEICFKKRLRNHIWWTTTLTPAYKRCKYYFELHTKDECIYYFEDGFYREDEMNRPGKVLSYFIFPWMNTADIYRTPSWVNETVWYQIFPERFCNGDVSNDPEGVKPWRYEKVGLRDYYGGDLLGITQKLPYLKELGITGIYLNPVFEADSNHKYNTKDYRRVDPHFGTNEQLRALVDLAHKLGMRVMLDGVFNHTGTDFAPWQDVVEHGAASRYADWYMIRDYPVESGRDTKDGRYYSFAFAENMPKLDTNNPAVIDYFLDIVRFWMQEFDIDGLRLDVGNEVSHRFLKELRRMTKEIRPDFYLLGEIWHDAIEWLRGDEYDAVMNYPLAAAISDFWVYQDWDKSRFEYAVNRCFTTYMQQTNDVLFNLLDSHDTNRLMDKTGDKDVFYQQLAALFTMPGSPCIYYGTEIAMEGGHDPDCRRCMPWEDIASGVYDSEIGELKKLIDLRVSERAFRSRNFHFPNRIADPRVIEYVKIEGDTCIEVCLNCGEHAAAVSGTDILYARHYEDGQLLPKGILIRSVGGERE